MPSFEPADHRVIITFPYHVLIIPNFIALKFVERLLILNQWISKIAKFKCIVVISTIFLDAYEIRIWKHENLRLIRFDCFELKWDIYSFVVD